MKFKIIAAALLLSFIPLSIVVSQEDLPVDTEPDVTVQSGVTEGEVAADEIGSLSNPFDIELTLDTQSPWNKSVPIIVKVVPNINTTRTNITWDAPLGVEITDRNSDKYVAVSEGETYSYTARVKPIQGGTYTISATATDWGYGENVASTVSKTITFDDNLVTSPQTPDYTTSVGIMYAIIGLGVLTLGILAYVFGKKGLNALKEWLKPPEL